jgi:hypothetical protein
LTALPSRHAQKRLSLAFLLSLTGLVLVVPGPRATAADSVAITGGTLTWGVKESFRSYVTGPIAGGSITVTGPATLAATVPTFADGSGTFAGDELSLATRGGVRFAGHHGELDLRFANPQLVVTGTSGTLRADVVDSTGSAADGLAIGTVDLSGAIAVSGTTVTVTRARVTLTAVGATAFRYQGTPMYPAGTAMDPVSATFTIEPAATASPSAPPTATASGSASPSASSPSASVTPGPSTKPTTSPSPTVSIRPTGTPAGKPDAATTSGWLSWGVKESFRSYLTGPIAHGAITVSGGARADGAGFRFGQSATTADPPRATGTSSYRGQVRFSGHAGVLDLAMSSPRVEVSSSTSAVLSLAVSGFGRVRLASLDLAGGSRSAGSDWVGWSGVPARLTAAGTKVFAYNGSAFYPAGTALDPVSFVIGATAATGSTSTVTVATASAAPSPSTSASATATASAPVTPSVVVPAAAAACQVTDAQLTWGFKESFRAYVTGTIANGDWTTSGNAGYTTPSFHWAAGGGSVDPASGTGQVGFSGAVRFTGHKGAMDTTIANPVIRWGGATHAVLLLDVSGVSMEEAMAGGDKRTTSTGVEFVDLDLAGGTAVREAGRVTVRAVPAALTAAGQAAFTNYPAGTAFDPITLSYTESSDCGASATPAASAAVAVAGQAEVPGWMWAGWAGSSAVGAVLGSAATLLVARRWLVKR